MRTPGRDLKIKHDKRDKKVQGAKREAKCQMTYVRKVELWALKTSPEDQRGVGQE